MSKQPAVDAQTSIGEKKTRKERAKKPLDYSEVRGHALNLSLSDQANLCKILKESVNQKLAVIQTEAKEAEQLVSGL